MFAAKRFKSIVYGYLVMFSIMLPHRCIWHCLPWQMSNTIRTNILSTSNQNYQTLKFIFLNKHYQGTCIYHIRIKQIISILSIYYVILIAEQSICIQNVRNYIFDQKNWLAKKACFYSIIFWWKTLGLVW